MFDLEERHVRDIAPKLLQDWVARLCMAEIESRGGSRQVVRYGSDINAPDDGVDVEVRAGSSDHIGDFIPRQWTRVQVKKQKMGKSDIKEEMAPKGRLRESIQCVVREQGCYMIVSLGADPAPIGIDPLQEAMLQEISEITADPGTVRFLGLSDLLNWANGHRPVRLWLRRKLGIEQHGWKPHESWSINGSNTEDTLVTDPGVRISINPRGGQTLDITDGIVQLRALAQGPLKSIRILGQSGIGKTRVVQALFECHPETDVLGHTKVIYGDWRTQLQPHPIALLEHLIIDAKETFLVVDNCPPDLHDTLARRVGSPDCRRVRLITVDDDIGHDSSGHTHVVQIRAQDTQATVKLLTLRFPGIGDRNAERIARFASGNAWAAILSARSFESGENIATLSDDAMLKRLAGSDDELIRSAEALSLAYWFTTETSGNVSELSVLGGLIDRSVRQIHYNGQRLRERQLIEDQGQWWAVLPLVIANRFASDALRRMLPEAMAAAFRPTVLPRLFLSFAHRISYLHDSDRAVEIAESWLSSDGPLSDLTNLDGGTAVVICYAAAIAPGPVLRKIEAWAAVAQNVDRAMESDHRVVSHMMDALTVIACEEDMFDRCIDALALVARRRYRCPFPWLLQTKAFRLFSYHLRWVRPGTGGRFDIVRRYLQSDSQAHQVDGHAMLLKAFNLKSPFNGFKEYGARSHDRDALPESGMGKAEWCTGLLELISESIPDLAENARHLVEHALAAAFSDLWEIPELRQPLAKVSEILGKTGSGGSGWAAVLETRSLRFAGGQIESRAGEHRSLTQIARTLRPRNPVDRVRARIRSLSNETLPGRDDPEILLPDMSRESLSASARLATRLGKCAARMESTSLRQFFSGMLGDGNEHAYFFARGAIRERADLELVWDGLLAESDKAGDEIPRPLGIFIAIIDEAGSRDSDLAQRILDKASEHPGLRKRFAALQERVELDARAVGRLERCLDDQAIDTESFAGIAWQESFLNLSEVTLVRLLRLVASKLGGAESVTRGLAARFRIPSKLPVGPAIADIGLTVATQVIQKCSNEWDLPMHPVKDLCSVIDACSGQHVSQSDLHLVLRELILKLPMFSRNSRAEGMFGVIGRLAKRAPHAALDMLFAEPENANVVDDFLRSWQERESSVFGLVGVEELLSWADRGDRESRLCQIARVLWPVNTRGDGEELHLTGTALATIEIAKEPVPIALAFAQSLSVVPRHSDRDTAISRRLAALQRFARHSDSATHRWAKAAALHLEEIAEEHRKKEQRHQPEPLE